MQPIFRHFSNLAEEGKRSVKELIYIDNRTSESPCPQLRIGALLFELLGTFLNDSFWAGQG